MQRGGPSSEGHGFKLPTGPIKRPELPSDLPGHETILKNDRTDEIIALLSQISESLSTHRTNPYDVSDSIGNALDSTGVTSTANNALRVDQSEYIRERIFDRIGMPAPKLNVYNDGPGTWYVRVSQEGQQFSDEIALFEGEKKTYSNVYEIRHRSDTLGLQYRVTELDIWQQTAISKAEKIEIYSTDSTLHFTGAIVMNAMETVDLTGLLSNRYMIRGVNIQSMQPLIYNLIFWSSDTFDDVVLNNDSFIDNVELDMSIAPAFRINGANQYYLNVGDLAIIYEDFDISRELHMGLQNTSPVAKIAGAAGAVQLDIKMSPRL